MAAPHKFRVDLKKAVRPLDTLAKSLETAVGKGRVKKKSVRRLMTTLRRVRRQLSHECCDGRFFCEF